MPILKTALTLKDLPPPPPNKVGWPWTEQTPPLPEFFPDGSNLPQISVVTPSYNQSQFIEESIRSVLLQGYPNLEYIIIDGGSTDNSVEVIKKYEKFLAYWVSEKDEGQANALNKGFRKVTGQLIGWQNSDDYYYPDSFRQAAQAATSESADIFYGSVNVSDEVGHVLRTVSATEFKLEEMFPWFKIFNESMFFRHKVLEENFINENYQHYLDYELFWRLIFADYQFQFVPSLSACRRLHAKAKGYTQLDIAARELFATYKMAYKHPNLPITVRSQIIDSCHSLCLDNFAKLRLDMFRTNVRDLVAISGFQVLELKLVIKYLLSFLGVRYLTRLRNMKEGKILTVRTDG
jgi:glycosyltransferase involved in cell wall biosynthesis